MSWYSSSCSRWVRTAHTRSNVMNSTFVTRHARRTVQISGDLLMKSLLALALLGAVPCTAGAASKINVIGATEDLAAIAREVGGDAVVVDSIAKGYQDPHFVEPKPS